MLTEMRFEILRDRQDAERELSNAIAAISEAALVLQQYRPKEKVALRIWEHQRKKLKMAIGLCGNVRRMIERDVAFESLRIQGRKW